MRDCDADDMVMLLSGIYDKFRSTMVPMIAGDYTAPSSRWDGYSYGRD